MSARDKLKNMMIESAKEEIDQIEDLMEKAALKGESKISLHKLSDGAKVWLDIEKIYYSYDDYTYQWELSWQ